jgi:hypothetical protein
MRLLAWRSEDETTQVTSPIKERGPCKMLQVLGQLVVGAERSLTIGERCRRSDQSDQWNYVKKRSGTLAIRQAGQSVACKVMQ